MVIQRHLSSKLEFIINICFKITCVVDSSRGNSSGFLYKGPNRIDVNSSEDLDSDKQ